MEAKHKILVWLSLLFAMPCVWGQTLSDYTFVTGTDNRWLEPTDMVAIGEGMGQSLADTITWSAMDTMGFPFRWGEWEYTHFTVNANALMVSLGDWPVSRDDGYHKRIWPCFVPYTNIDYMLHKKAEYGWVGTAPHRVLVVTFSLAPVMSFATRYRYQLQFHEDSSQVTMVFDPSPSWPPTSAMFDEDGYYQSQTIVSIDRFNLVSVYQPLNSQFSTLMNNDAPFDSGRYFQWTLQPRPATPVRRVRTEYLDPVSVTLRWEEAGTCYDSTTTYWIVQYGTGTEWTPSNMNSGFVDTVWEPRVALTNLVPDVTYRFYISTVYDNEHRNTPTVTEVKMPVAPPVTELPYECNFDYGTEGWTMIRNSVNGWTLSRGGLEVLTEGDTVLVYSPQDNSYAYRDFWLDTGYYALDFDYCERPGLPTLKMAMYGNGYLPQRRSLMPSTQFVKGTAEGSLPPTMEYENSWDYEADMIPHHLPFVIDTQGYYRIVFHYHEPIFGSPTVIAPKIDNIRLRKVLCPEPSNFRVVQMDSNSITVRWNMDDSNSLYRVAAYGYGWSHTAVVNDSTYTFNLMPSNMSYTLSLKHQCGDSLFSDSLTLQSHTLCGYVTSLPFYEDFNSWEGEMPVCWDSILFNPGYISWNFENRVSIPYYQLQNGVAYGQLTMPRIDIATDNVYLRFKARTVGRVTEGERMSMVVASNPLGSQWTVIDTIEMECTSLHGYHPLSDNPYEADGWEEYELLLDGLQPGQNRISFWPSHLSQTLTQIFGRERYLQIDDVMLTTSPICPSVDSLQAVWVDSNTFEVTWTGGSESYEMAVVPYSETPTEPLSSYVFVQTPYLTTGLQYGQSYRIWVRSVCANGEVSIGKSVVITVPENLTNSPLPYICHFDDSTENAQWVTRCTRVLSFSQIASRNQWTTGSAVWYGDHDNLSMYVSNDGGLHNTYDNSPEGRLLGYRTFRLDTGSYIVQFAYRYNGATNHRLSAYVQRLPTNPNDWESNRIELQTLQRTTAWNVIRDSFHIDEEGFYRLMFCWQISGDADAIPPAAAVDDVVLTANACMPPSTMTLVDQQEHSIGLTWPAADAQAWYLTIEDEWQVVADTTVYNNAVTFAGLSGSREYTVTVYPLCGEGTQPALFRQFLFMTACGTITDLPYNQYFAHSEYATQLSACWTRLHANGVSPRVQTSSQTLEFNSNVAAGIWSPRMGMALDSLRVTFSWLDRGSRDTLRIYAADTLTQIGDNGTTGIVSSLQLVAEVVSTRSGVYRTESVDLSLAEATGHYLLFYVPAQGGISISSIVIDWGPDCGRIHRPTVVEHDAESVTIDWFDRHNSSWMVAYATVGTPMYRAQTMTVGQHPCTITSLDPATPYYFKVTPLCDGATAGVWSDSVAITTEFCNGAYSTIGQHNYSIANYPVTCGSTRSLDQIIIDSAWFRTGHTIDGVAFKVKNSTICGGLLSDAMVYMAHTDKDVFLSDTDYVRLSLPSQQLVCHGISYIDTGWCNIPFDTPFEWDGHSNVVLSVYRFTLDENDMTTSADAIAATQRPSYQRIRCSDYSHSEIETLYHRTGIRSRLYPHLRLISCNPCMSPQLVEVDASSYVAALRWHPTGATSYEVWWRETEGGQWHQQSVNDTILLLTGLLPDVQYQYRVRSLCDEDEVSPWSEAAFSTIDAPCLPPTSLTVGVSAGTATFEWSGDEAGAYYRLHLFNTIDNMYRYTTSSQVVIHNLVQGRVYYAAVQRLCVDTLVMSPWSDTIVFQMEDCDTVRGLHVVSLSQGSAIIGWDPFEEGTGITEVKYGYHGFPVGEELGRYVTSDNTVLLEGLLSGVDYDVFARHYCQSNMVGNWVGVSFTSLVEIEDIVRDMEMLVFPNPTRDRLTIRCDRMGDGPSTLTLYSSDGRRMYEGRCSATEHVVDVSGLPQGLYLLRVVTPSGVALRRVVVKR